MQIKLKSFTLTKREYLRLLTALQKEKFKVLTRVVYLLIFAIFIFLIWGAFQGLFFELLIAWYPLVLLLSAWIFFIIYGQALYFTFSKMNRHQFQSYEYIISDNSIIMKRGDGASSELPISKIVKIYCVKDHYYLLENLASGHIIPVSAFNSEEDIREFKDKIKQHLN